MMSNLKLDLARSLELLRFCIIITSIVILNLIFQNFFVIIGCQCSISRILCVDDKVFGFVLDSSLELLLHL